MRMFGILMGTIVSLFIGIMILDKDCPECD